MLASTSNVLAQQGIGTNTPHRSAALQIDSKNKGILIPRINLEFTSNIIKAPSITTPVKGLLIFNEAEYLPDFDENKKVGEGFYYYDGTNWNPISKSYLQDSDHTTITGDGTVTPYKVQLKPATTIQLGGVKIGENINVDVNGTISVSFPASTVDTNTTTTVSTDQSYVNVDLTQTVGDGTTPINTRDYKIGVDKATANEFGVVKPGAGLSIAENGTLKVDFPTDNNTTYSAGTGITLNGTVFNVPVNVLGGGNVITGVTSSVTGLDFSTSQIATTDTMYSAGNGITLTDTQFSVPVTTSSSSDANGNVITNVVQTANGIEITKATIEITDTVTDIQKVAAQNYVTITSDPSTPIAGTDRTYTIGVEKATANEFGVVKPGTGLTIDNGTINVSVVDTNTDNQQLTFNPTTNILTLERGGDPINLSALAVDNDTKTKVVSGTNVTVSPTTDPTNTSLNTYTVNVATASSNAVGVVKPGTGLSVATDGTLNVTVPNYTTTERDTGRKWLDNKVVYERVDVITLTETNTYTLPTTNRPSKILSIRLLGTDGSVTTELTRYNSSTGVMVFGTGRTAFSQKAQQYHLILEYIK